MMAKIKTEHARVYYGVWGFKDKVSQNLYL